MPALLSRIYQMVKFTDGALHHGFGVLDLGQIGFHGNNPATVLLQVGRDHC
jgi:hypothetical protein